jgi:hypothetical protein
VIVAWLLFPLLMVAVCLGCGLTVERIGGWRLPGALLLSVGLALIIVAATLTTDSATTARFTTAVVVILALAGYALSWRRLRTMAPDPWTLGLGIAVYAVCAAPVVASGQATFLGYSVDGDPTIHFALISQLLAHGRTLNDVPFSNYSSIWILLNTYLNSAYPVGADIGLGALRPLVGQNVAWIYQPYLAVIMALGAVALYELLDGVVRLRALRALCAFIAAQAGLAYSFYLVASIKELATAWIITVTVALVVATLRRPFRLREVAALVVVSVAGLDTLAIAIVPWLGIPLALFVVVAAWRLRHQLQRRPSPRMMAGAVGFVAILLVIAAPILRGASTFVSVTSSALSEAGELGDLVAPLSKLQVFGIWPSGDFRYPVTTHTRLAHVLLGIAVASAVLGVLWMVRRRAWGPLLMVVGNIIAAIVLLGPASPYAASKVLMIVSVTAVMAAMLGGAALYDSGQRVVGWVLAGVIAAGVLWTNVVDYHHARPAPKARLTELAAINSRFSGQIPAFYNMWDYEYPMYFLRNLGVAVPNTLGNAVQRAGSTARTPAQTIVSWDPNDLDQSYLQGLRLLVLGRSPTLSRPPADFRLVDQTRFYDVWKRTETPQVLEHTSIGGGLSPQGPQTCAQIRRIGVQAARRHGHIDYVVQPALPSFDPVKSVHPPAWYPNVGDDSVKPDLLQLNQQAGTVTGKVRIPAAGRYQVWLEGSLTQPVSVSVGLRPAGSVSDQLGPPGLFRQVGTVTLTAGEQPVVIRRSGAGLGPTNYAPGDSLGPLVLVNGSETAALQQIPAADARSLCGRALEWIEIVR